MYFDRVETENRAKRGLTGLQIEPDPLWKSAMYLFSSSRVRVAFVPPPRLRSAVDRRPPAAVDRRLRSPLTAACLPPEIAAVAGNTAQT
jgi:hypothetical protein